VSCGRHSEGFVELKDRPGGLPIGLIEMRCV
jgi:hypothetical protein